MEKTLKLAQEFRILPGTSPRDWDLFTVVEVVGNIITILLSVAGVVAVIFLIVGAIKYSTSFGNPQQMESAKATLLWSLIGLVVILCSYAIMLFVWNRFTGNSPLTS